MDRADLEEIANKMLGEKPIRSNPYMYRMSIDGGIYAIDAKGLPGSLPTGREEIYLAELTDPERGHVLERDRAETQDRYHNLVKDAAPNNRKTNQLTCDIKTVSTRWGEREVYDYHVKPASPEARAQALKNIRRGKRRRDNTKWDIGVVCGPFEIIQKYDYWRFKVRCSVCNGYHDISRYRLIVSQKCPEDHGGRQKRRRKKRKMC